MAKNPKQLLKEKKNVGAGPGPLKEKPKTQEPEGFNWGGFLIPDAQKVAIFALMVLVTVGAFGALVATRNISMDSVQYTVFDFKVVLLLVSIYFWVCYAVERKLGIVRTVLPVLLPELLIIIYILMRVPKFVPPS
ncbi:MAG: hypothetical protein ABIF01_04330 [Candidatus Micrarchaeota archaeon]